MCHTRSSVPSPLYLTLVVVKTCRSIIDDVEKLDVIQDGFIHYQLLRFCQTTRLQYLNSHILLGNRCVLQQQHVDCKIDDTILKKRTKYHTDGWDDASKVWSHMVFHLPHVDGGFGVECNDITKDTAFVVVYYESLKRALKTKTIYGYRCDERLKTNVKESTRLTCLLYYYFTFRDLTWCFLSGTSGSVVAQG